MICICDSSTCGSLSLIRKTANGPLAGKTYVQSSSRGDAWSSGIGTSQEHILDDKIEAIIAMVYSHFLMLLFLETMRKMIIMLIKKGHLTDVCWNFMRNCVNCVQIYLTLTNSLEKKGSDSVVHLLKELNAPLKVFTWILCWLAQANASGLIFQVYCQPSWEEVEQKMDWNYNMNGLIPRKKQLYLPYSKRIVSMVYLDASQVFASLLSCPCLLNCNKTFFILCI
jgi:hypothetical protein